MNINIDDIENDDDFIWFECLYCQEEYYLPESTTQCPICGQCELETL